MTPIELFLLRRQKGITLTEIAKSIGCSVAMLSLHENNKANMNLVKVCKYKEYILNK